MPIGDLASEISVLLCAVAIVLGSLVLPRKRLGLAAPVAVAGFALAIALAFPDRNADRLTFSGVFALDELTFQARVLIFGTAALCAVLSFKWFETDHRRGEYYAMLALSALGAMAMAGAADLLQLLIAVLLSSITGYVLAAYHRGWAPSLEAGMKYFLIGGLANALLTFGVVLVVGVSGATPYTAIDADLVKDPLGATGLVLILIGLFYKLGAVPAHAWTPDVAEGAPAPSAAFLTAAPKIGAAIALARLVSEAPANAQTLTLFLALIAFATMTLGNFAALAQDDMRRMIGWSSVSQAGYALMAVAAAGASALAEPALVAFMAAYAAANIGAFAAVISLRGRTARTDYAGLFRTRPFEAAVLSVALLSLVGIPPLAGFAGKAALFAAALEADLAWLVVAAAANTVLSLAYYLRFIAPMVFRVPQERPQILGGGARVVQGLTAAGLLAAPIAFAVWS